MRFMRSITRILSGANWPVRIALVIAILGAAGLATVMFIAAFKVALVFLARLVVALFFFYMVLAMFCPAAAKTYLRILGHILNKILLGIERSLGHSPPKEKSRDE